MRTRHFTRIRGWANGDSDYARPHIASAACVDYVCGIISPTSLDLNNCLRNDNGRPVGSRMRGGFTSSCNFCRVTDIGKVPISILPVHQTGDPDEKKGPTDRDSALLLGEILHSWFGYLSCFGHHNPNLTPRDYDCRGEGWQPEKDAEDNTCASPYDVEWEHPGHTRWIGVTAVMAAVRGTYRYEDDV
ncbi:hypothetical protein DL770_005687 [Monosporascus sp. CRB-9-2]|nr:hypothetical protein DL770_005687 [Monosporascus sp. CRB-9-2]